MGITNEVKVKSGMKMTIEIKKMLEMDSVFKMKMKLEIQKITEWRFSLNYCSILI